MIVWVNALHSLARRGYMGPESGQIADGWSYRDEHLQLDSSSAVHIDNCDVTLTATEYALLAFLTRHAGVTVTSGALLAAILGDGAGARTLDIHMRRLQSKLWPYGQWYIQTICETGYRFQPFDQGARIH